ncbi:minor tail protein [Mycobacterium phage Muddy]|uniref:Minor tail protein n=2 Tax=Mycobacterium phage Muddy TaxID=1340829 RepID=A0ACD4QA95_9CAUD|nr:minor tail protein [Mycobacterium phage Muddy]WEV84069.1 minor tail protein [Mycobacterium phage Muddy]
MEQGWTTTPTDPIIKPEWSTSRPPVIPSGVLTEWEVRISRRLRDEGIGEDAATLLPLLLASDAGLGSDLALAHHLIGTSDTGVGEDLARLGLLAADSGVGADDLLSLSLRIADSGIGTDLLSSFKPSYGIFDSAVGTDLAGFTAKANVADSGVGQDVATGGFSPMAAATTVITASGTYRIPVQCRYIDLIVLGGGGGGKGMPLFGVWGQGGFAGSWNYVRLERGVDIPWTAITITITIGNGGNGGTGGGGGSAGGATTITISGWGTLTGAGGAGGTQSNLDTAGKSPGNITFQGQPYNGGAEQGSAGAAGNIPGGGGAAATVTLAAGGAGARGQAWIRASQ